MSDTASTVWKVLGTVAVVTLVAVAALVGPRVYRAGRSVVAPVVEMNRLEDQLAALDAEFPPPPGGPALDADRLRDFLAVRHDLLPVYKAWDEVVQEVEARGESWAGARDVLAATRDVMRTQIEALRARSMSPGEFHALERLVYDRWLDRLGGPGVPGGTPHDAVVAEVTRSDLEFVREVARRDGSSPGLTAVERRLAERLDALATGGPLTVDGVPPEVGALLWAHHDEIAALRLGTHAMHSTLRSPGQGAVQIRVGTEGTSAAADPRPEPTPPSR